MLRNGIITILNLTPGPFTSRVTIITRRHIVALTSGRSFASNMSSSVPSSMKAVLVDGNKAKVASDVPIPKIRPTYLLAKVEAVALNPTDWKHIAGKRAAPNGISGCDFSGTVVEVGPEVTKSFKPGDRVAGTAHGANYSQPEDGVFAEYAMVKGDLLVKLPDSLSFEAAATFPLGVSTVGQGLFQKALKLNLPTDPVKGSTPVLIYVSQHRLAYALLHTDT